jgi:GntR family carbon starvation induced transcriptional regulator
MNDFVHARFERGDHPSLRAAVYSALKQRVLDGRLEPGKPIILRDLQSQFGVSLSVLRESLCQLAADGMVIAVEQRGFRAAPISAADLEDLTRVRATIESAAVRDAIAHGDAAWESRLLTAFHELTEARKRFAPLSEHHEEYQQLHRAFHDAIVEPCTSQWTKRFRATLHDHSQRYRQLARTTQTTRDIDGEHRAILAAVLSQDGNEAARLLSEHVHETARILLRSGWADAENPTSA